MGDQERRDAARTLAWAIMLTEPYKDSAVRLSLDLFESRLSLKDLQEFSQIVSGEKEGKQVGEALEMTEDELLQAAAKIKPPKRSQSSKKSKGRDTKDPGANTESPLGPDPDVWMSIHVYRRPGETDAKVDMSARSEREDRGPATIIFKHYHMFGEVCEPKCKEKVDG